jgi:hypothetical protein
LNSKIKTVSAIYLCAAAVAALLGSTPAHAAVVTFAHYEEALSTSGASLFTYTETGTSGSGGTAKLTAVSVPVTFSFESLPGLPADLQGPQAATLTLTTSTGAPVTNATAPAVSQEPFNLVGSDTLTITRNTAAGEGTGPKTNLLTMTFTGTLNAQDGGGTAQLTGQTALGFAVNYSSNFLTFTNPTVQDYSLNFTSWITTADNGAVEFDSVSNFFKTATAAGTGSFDTNVVAVPEPISAALILSSLGLLSRRRRRAI